MWEYLTKKIRPGRPRPESADVHQPHDVGPQTQSAQVDVHGDDASKGKEAELFAHLDVAGPRRYAREQERKRRRETRRELRCPVCKTRMTLERIGKVELDRCSGCGGIFLDRGELEQLSGRDPSSYVPSDPASEQADRDFLIYTPHGLSDHVRDP